MKTTILILSLTMMITGCNTITGTYNADLLQYFQHAPDDPAVLMSSDIAHLPDPVQHYLHFCGFVGHERIFNAEVVWESSAIKMAPEKKWMKLKTLQFNSTQTPFRIAYMKARIAGIIPFEGRDIFAEGQGHMYGKVANLITVFDEKEPEISQSALVIILAEALLVPGYALSDYIAWEAVDSLSAKATISYKGVVASGTFYFDESGAMIRFESPERYYMDPEKGNILKPFIAEVGPYKTQGPLKIPTSMQAVWKLEQGNYTYWKGTIKELKYNL